MADNLRLTDRGAIDIDDFCRTNVSGIYAIGDVTAKMMLAHTAKAQGVVTAETIGAAHNMMSPAAVVLAFLSVVLFLLDGWRMKE